MKTGMWMGGMRMGELRALRWQDVVSASAVAALKAHRHLRGKRVFLNLDGEDMSLSEWRHGLYVVTRRSR